MSKKKKAKKRSSVAAVCSILGTILLIIVVICCVPLTVPKVFGYQIYTVISGSMEPAIPTGSLVYIKNIAPEQIEKDDVIAFHEAMDTTSIITHRVVTNGKLQGEFITKGDANKENDMKPISYDDYDGKVVLSVPKVGGIAQTFTTGSGRILSVGIIGIAILLHIIASVLGRKDEE